MEQSPLLGWIEIERKGRRDAAEIAAGRIRTHAAAVCVFQTPEAVSFGTDTEKSDFRQAFITVGGRSFFCKNKIRPCCVPTVY